MAQEIKMPAAGQTTNKATIANVLVHVGDQVKRGDVLLEAETDKAILPVESYASGHILAILVEAGDRVTAGDVLLAIGKEGETYVGKGKELPDVKTEPKKIQSGDVPIEEDEYRPIIKGEKMETVSLPVSKKAEPTVTYPAMPGAKMLAKELGIDISAVSPKNGALIKRADVRAAVEALERSKQEECKQQASPAEYEVIPMTTMREIIGKRMLQSVLTIPAFQCSVRMDMSKCMELRRVYQEKREIKLSYNDILAKAVAVASQKFPLIRSRYEDEEIRVYPHSNIGLAVGLEKGLVVPVLKAVDRMGLEEISAGYKAAVKKARENQLTPADMGCGNITISNLGMYDIDQFVAIVNPPECGILAVGKIEMQPVWDGKEFLPVPCMNVTGSFDHRIIDGAYGAQFMQELKLLVENPSLLLG